MNPQTTPRTSKAAALTLVAFQSLPCGCVSGVYRARPTVVELELLEAKGPHFVVSWEGTHAYAVAPSLGTGPYSYQIQLYEANGAIVLAYAAGWALMAKIANRSARALLARANAASSGTNPLVVFRHAQIWWFHR